jgi:hypothetical protein
MLLEEDTSGRGGSIYYSPYSPDYRARCGPTLARLHASFSTAIIWRLYGRRLSTPWAVFSATPSTRVGKHTMEFLFHRRLTSNGRRIITKSERAQPKNERRRRYSREVHSQPPPGTELQQLSMGYAARPGSAASPYLHSRNSKRSAALHRQKNWLQLARRREQS